MSETMANVARPPVLLLALLCLAAPLLAADWPEWRGPTRGGVAAESPPLAESWPADGPRQVWRSEFIPSGDRGNLSSPVIANGRVYVHANWKYAEPVATRVLTDSSLSDLKREPGVNPIVVGYLEQIKDRVFASQDELDRWMTDHSVTGRMRTLAMKHVALTREAARDSLVCLDAASGRTLWKAESPGVYVGVSSSSTPCVADERCTFVGSGRNVHCVDARTGDLIWSAKTQRGDQVSSSILVADGVAVVLAKELVGLSARSGDVLWTQPAVAGDTNSPALWRHEGKAYAVVSTSQKVAAVDIATGRLAWAVPGMKGGHSSPAIDGDRMAVLGSDGLGGYRLAADGAERLWVAGAVRSDAPSPILLGGCVYAVANRTACVEFATGRVLWEHRTSGYVSSPLAADGKLIGTDSDELFLLKASPEACVPLARARLGLLHCASPALVDGRLYVRLEDSVACYDLRKTATD